MRPVTALIAIPLLAASAGIAAEVDARRVPTFETGVEVVNLNVAVSGRGDRFVTDLEESNFEVFEDGVRQSLSLCTRQSLPLSVVLLIDASGSMLPKMAAAQAAATRLVARLRPDDEVEVVQFSGRTVVKEPFTTDRARAEAAIQSTVPEGDTALYDTLYIALKELQPLASAEPMRRFAIVLLSDGRDTTSLNGEEEVLELARRSAVSIQAVSLPGEVGTADPLELRRVRHFLTELTRVTGGFAHFPERLQDLEPLYGRIAEGLRSQYSIAYVPEPRRQDGGWRQIAVIVRGRTDVSVRHKPGYYAPKPRRSARSGR